MSWIELSLNTTAEAVDWVRTLLAVCHYTGTLQIQPYTAAVDPSETTAPSEAWAFHLRWHLPNQTGARSQVTRMSEQLASLHRTGMTSLLETSLVDQVPVVETAAAIARIGERFVLLPADANYTPQSSAEIPLRLNPSLAFGSGFHPATVLMLQLLEHYASPPLNALDLGCGSGILSVAMAKMGARVLALDNDRVAVQATEDMVKLNQVESQVVVAAGSLGRGSDLGHWMGEEADFVTAPAVAQPDGEVALAQLPPLDLIAANILARVHLALAEDYARALRQARHPAGGVLLTAGFTQDYADEVNQALSRAGFVAIAQVQQGEWRAIVSRLQP